MTERIVRRTPLKRSAFKRKPPKPGFSKATREFILRRDGGCTLRDRRDCWGGLHAHHVLPRARGGSNDADNGASLCAWHHQWVHAYPLESKPLGLLR